MAALYIALLLGLVAAVGVFTSVSAFNPPAPTNADVVEGRLRVYENAVPLSVTEIELREPFGERVLRPLAKRVGKLVEQSMPEKARQSIAHNLMVAGRPGGMSAGDFIAMRYVLTALLCGFGILIGVLTHNPIALALLAAIGAGVGLYGPVIWLRMKLNGRRADIQAALTRLSGRSWAISIGSTLRLSKSYTTTGSSGTTPAARSSGVSTPGPSRLPAGTSIGEYRSRAQRAPVATTTWVAPSPRTSSAESRLPR